MSYQVTLIDAGDLLIYTTIGGRFLGFWPQKLATQSESFPANLKNVN